jgi:hypothetical protein
VPHQRLPLQLRPGSDRPGALACEVGGRSASGLAPVLGALAAARAACGVPRIGLAVPQLAEPGLDLTEAVVLELVVNEVPDAGADLVLIGDPV